MSYLVLEQILHYEDGYNMRRLWDTIGSLSADLSAHNLVLGVPDPNDFILYHQIINKKSQPFFRRSELVSYPCKRNQYLNKVKITGIAILDVKEDGKGGEAVVESGGVGSHFVDIRLSSGLFRGFSFQIIIIGKYLAEVNQEIYSPD